MLPNMQDYVEIPRRATERSCLTQTREANPGTVFHPRWNLGVEATLAQHPPLPLALGTGIGNDTARALARRTGARDTEKSLLITNLAAPPTGPARYRRLPRRRA